MASSGITPSVDCDIEIHYVPKLFHRLAVFKTCERLLEKVDLVSDGRASKELEVIQKRIWNVENTLANKYALNASSRVKYYDKHYGVNLHRVIQDHNRNLYVGSTGWI